MKRISKAKMLDALALLSPGLGKNELVEHAGNFTFIGSGLCTYNDAVSVIYPWKLGIHGGVPADDFLKMTRAIRALKFTIAQEGNVIRMVGKSTVAEIISSDPKAVEKKLLALDPMNKKWKALPDDFVEAIQVCLLSVSRDTTVPHMTGLLVGEEFVFSTDDLRISAYYFEEDVMDDTFLLPSVAAKALVKMEPIEYCLKENWAFFRSEDGVVLCANLLDKGDIKKFDGWQRMLEVKGKSFDFPAATAKIVENLAGLASGDFESDLNIEVLISSKDSKDKFVQCMARKKEVGWIRERVKLSTKFSGDISFSINPVFFSQILEQTRQASIGEERIFFETENFKHSIWFYGV